MISWAVISIFGLIIAVRTAKFFRFDESKSIFITTIIILFLKNHKMTLALLFSVMLVVPILHRFLIVVRIQSRFSDHFVSFLDEILMNMRLGHSLYSSIKSSAGIFGDYISNEVIKTIHDNNYHPFWLRKNCHHLWIDELRDVNQNPQRQIQRVEALRTQVSTLKSFRQKSRVATTTAQAQTAILLVLYLALLGFSLLRWDLQKNGHIFLISISLFVVGLCLFHLILKVGIKWKI